jgi:hypothetical protein
MRTVEARGGVRGQGDDERRAAMLFADDVDTAVMGIDDLSHERQSNACAVRALRMKHVVDLLTLTRIDTAALIDHLEDGRVRRDAAGAHAHTGSAR